MELLLWLYLYDKRWLLNLEISSRAYRNLWVGMIAYHFVYFISLLFNYLQSSESFTFKTAANQILCLVTVLTIILFLVKLNSEEQKHLRHSTKFQRVNKESHMFKPIQNDYWIRTRTIYSGPGIFLLILSLVSFVRLNLDTTKFEFKGESKAILLVLKILFTLLYYFIFYSNFFVVLLSFILVNVKVFFFVTSSVCPKAHSKFAQVINSKKTQTIIKLY